MYLYVRPVHGKEVRRGLSFRGQRRGNIEMDYPPLYGR